jgi:hypothetical protein
MYFSPPMPPPKPARAPRHRCGVLGKAWRLLLVGSVLTSIAAGVLWWRGQTRADYVGWSGGDVHLGLLNEDGIARLEWSSDQAIPAGWRALTMSPSPRLRGWQSSWEGDLSAATRVGGQYGVSWRVWKTGRGAFAHGGRPRRSLYLSHPFLAGVGLVLPAAWLVARMVAVQRRAKRDDEAFEPPSGLTFQRPRI